MQRNCENIALKLTGSVGNNKIEMTQDADIDWIVLAHQLIKILYLNKSKMNGVNIKLDY